jgi:hypothetical protein
VAPPKQQDSIVPTGRAIDQLEAEELRLVPNFRGLTLVQTGKLKKHMPIVSYDPLISGDLLRPSNGEPRADAHSR